MLLSRYQVHSAFNWQLVITPKPLIHSSNIIYSLLALSDYSLIIFNKSIYTVDIPITNAPKINNATVWSNQLLSHHPDLLMYNLFEIGLVTPYALPNEDVQVSQGPAKIPPQILQWYDPQNHSKQAMQACYAPLPPLPQYTSCVSIHTYLERSQRSTQEPKRDPSGPEGTARSPQAEAIRTVRPQRILPSAPERTPPITTEWLNIVLCVVLCDIQLLLRDIWLMLCAPFTIQHMICMWMT